MIENQKIKLQIQNTTTNKKSNMERKIEGKKDDQVQTNIKIINSETLVYHDWGSLISLIDRVRCMSVECMVSREYKLIYLR